ncbi:MAG: DinB family protein [Acidobacteriaceae bacterium]|nr:DinB family protein [Acidobacteriaceae bacterium]MBV9296514.1 DinB family protein [Acidobacteriaceae bacterium]MBV9764704.1 DinB family protein [Acidobacteriaceae bacterium]
MSNQESVTLRQMVVDALRGHQAHIVFDSAIEDFPVEARGRKPPGAPHTPWQLLEHMRIAQKDILEFSRDPRHKSPDWPESYWPPTEAPPSSKAWDESVHAFQKDALEFSRLVQDLQNNLFEPFEHGDGQTLLREALLLTTHNSYHLGQLVFMKKTLGG